MPTTMAARRELRPPINRFETDGSLLSSATEDNETPGLQSQQFKLTSFARQEDPVVRWFFRPGTLALVGAVAGCLALLAHNLPKLQLPERVQAHLGLWNACAVLMIFCMLQCRDGPFRRPHPSVWRLVLATNLIYLLALVYLYFQSKDFAREFMRFFDISLGKPIKEKDYGENCDFTVDNFFGGLFDLFAVAHTLGWFGKALILRDWFFCTLLSIMYELTEYSFAHQLDNFKECWWDHWILDGKPALSYYCLLISPTSYSLMLCKYLYVSPLPWRGRLAGRAAPYDFTEFSWRSVHTFRAYLSTVCLLFIFLSAEINVFYLKYLLWIPADHPLVTIRLAFFFLWALPGVREYYEYVTYGRKIKRMGAHASTALITVLVELLCIYKWSADEFPAPAPRHIKISWAIFATLLVVYPAIRFGLPALRRRGKKRRSRASSPAPREDVPTPSRKQNGYAGPSARRRREL